MLLLLLQLTLGALVATVALHVYDAEKGQRYARDVFSLKVDTMGQRVVETREPFTHESLARLSALAPDVDTLALHSGHFYRPEAVFGGERFKFNGIGMVSEDYPGLLGITFVQGSMFTADEARMNEAVIVLEEEVSGFIFGDLDPLGQELLLFPGSRLHEQRVEVTGVYRYEAGFERKADGALGRYAALVPSPPGGASGLVVLAKAGSAGAAREQILAAARHSFRGLLGTGDGTDVFIEEADRPFNAFGVVDANLLLFSLIGITALILAGVGIFSATVVDVAEQSYSIGVRRALGASGWWIAREFMTGAVLLALVAGVISFLLSGFIVPLLDSRLGETLFPGVTIIFKPLLGVSAVLLVVLFSAGLGLLPALRVGHLTPTAALNEV
jgi:hypothetical protein